MHDLDAENELTGDDKIIAEAKRRWKQCVDFEAVARARFVEDYKFFNADTDNKYQWPDNIRNGRETANRPCITINKTRQHCLHIINDAKQNTPMVKILPVGDEATFESAQVYQGLIRHIEYISNAAVAYDTATEFQVISGIGYWRVVTDYAGDDTFDQEVYIRRIKDPKNIYLDPDITEKDGSDARYAFVFTDMSKEEFNQAYPKYKDFGKRPALDDSEIYDDEYHVRVCEYFRVIENEDKLFAMKHPVTGVENTQRLSEVPEELKKYAQKVIDAPDSKYRTIISNEVEHYLIIGDEVAQKSIWPGKYIPIVRVIGEESIIDGEMDRKGHVRALKDPQRIYNYAASSATEVVALQSKSPYIAAAQSIEGLETYWASANTTNSAVLPYNHKDDDGDPLPAPERQSLPMPAPAFIQLMQDSNQQMDMASGQYEATFGEKSNERSGKAIDARQRQGETATYHYIDNLAVAIRFTGKILLDVIPKIYDVPRTIRILAEDNSTQQIQLDPNAAQAYAQQVHQHTQEVKRIFNPNVGKYDVVADVAPGYATKRDEAFNALSQIIASNPDSLTILGDLWAENADFPTSDKIAQRLRNMLPPQALGKAPAIDPAQMQKLQEQGQKMQEVNAKLMQKLSEDSIKMKDYAAQKDIDVYKAITERMKVESGIISDHVLTPKDSAMLQHDLAMQEHKGNLDGLAQAMQQDAIKDS